MPNLMDWSDISEFVERSLAETARQVHLQDKEMRILSPENYRDIQKKKQEEKERIVRESAIPDEEVANSFISQLNSRIAAGVLRLGEHACISLKPSRRGDQGSTAEYLRKLFAEEGWELKIQQIDYPKSGETSMWFWFYLREARMPRTPERNLPRTASPPTLDSSKLPVPAVAAGEPLGNRPWWKFW